MLYKIQDYKNKFDEEVGLSDFIQELQLINKQLAPLICRKNELITLIIDELDHNHEGQKTYEYQAWKIEVKTPCVYSLNKKMYESGQITLPDNFNPIKQSISYSIDKKLCDQYINDAPKKVKQKLIKLIDKKPGKKTVNIKDRI